MTVCACLTCGRLQQISRSLLYVSVHVKSDFCPWNCPVNLNTCVISVSISQQLSIQSTELKRSVMSCVLGSITWHAVGKVDPLIHISFLILSNVTYVGKRKVRCSTRWKKDALFLLTCVGRVHTYIHTYKHTYIHTCLSTHLTACLTPCLPACLPS